MFSVIYRAFCQSSLENLIKEDLESKNYIAEFRYNTNRQKLKSNKVNMMKFANIIRSRTLIFPIGTQTFPTSRRIITESTIADILMTYYTKF